jgi:arylsulfatase A-like enzyme
VLLVTLDTTRADRFGCYGYALDTTPNFDALAADGIRFETAISTSAVTPVSHASIMTGLNPYRHGVRVLYAASAYNLPPTVPTLATILEREGWDTGGFLSSFAVSETFGFQHGFKHFDNGLTDSSQGMRRDERTGNWSWDLRSSQRRSDETTDAVLRWLESARSPFFAWVHYWDPHDPVVLPPPEILSRFPARSNTWSDKRRALYDAETFYMDAQFGRLVQALKQRGQYEDTIIVVVADHGQGLGDHDWWYHRILYQEQIQLPLIMRIPGEPVGVAVSDLVRAIDIFPTVMETLEIEPPTPVEGLSLLGLIRGRREPPRIAYADQLNLYDLNANMLKKRPDDDLLYCAMDRSWKLIYRSLRPDESELYDLQADPREQRNLFKRENLQAQRLLAALNEFGGFVGKPFGPGRDDAALERLRSLGYAGD